MSAGISGVTKKFFKRKLPPSAVSLLIVLFVFVWTYTAQHLGFFQVQEFQVYDFFIRNQPRAASSDPIVLVEMTESDIHSPTLDYPIYDEKLAELLRVLEAGQPAVIGLDIWRDIPVPKNGKGIEEFNQVLLTYSNIVAIFTLGGLQSPIAPPPILKSDPERVAFNDNFPLDDKVDRTSQKVRRCTLLATGKSEDGSEQPFDSLPFRVALLYLQRKGIEPEPDGSNTNSFRLGKATLRKFQPNDGAYVGADAKGWQMLLDFKCPDQFKRYSVSQALSGEIPPETLRDKIVLVGINTPSVSDERVTPISRSHKGIEVQSQAIHQLLRQAQNGEQRLRFLDDWLEDTWMLLWCAAGGAIGYALRSPW